MLNLIRKELILSKRAIGISFVIITAYLIWSSIMIGSSNVYILIVSFMVGLVFPFTFQAREDRFKAAVLSCSLPFRRSTIVVSKFMTSWILIIGGLLHAFLIVSVNPFSKIKAGQLLTLKSLLIILFFTSLIAVFILPFIFRFGMVGVIVFLVSTQMLGVFFMIMAQLIGSKQNIVRKTINAIFEGLRYLLNHVGTPVFFLVLAVSIVLLNLVSLKVSQALYARRDF